MSEASPRVLVIDDEAPIRRFLRASLAAHGYTVAEASTGREGINGVLAFRPDVVILDLGLPDIDGIDVTSQMREWTRVPIVVLSVRDQETGKVAALDAGADDYLTKPFNAKELVARVKAVLRRTYHPEEIETTVLTCGDLEIDFARHSVTVRGERVMLTRTEYELLRHLV